HIWIRQDGKCISTIDLFRGPWTLLSHNTGWEHLLQEARQGLTFSAIFVEVIQDEPISLSFQEAFGVGPNGASLVRPDGYIAWRLVTQPCSAKDLAQVLRKVLFAT